MACEVTKEDIQKRIKNQIADRFDSIKFTKYSDRLVGFVPYNALNPSKDVLYGKVKKIESQINEDYNSKVFGPIVSFNQTKDGVEISIHPPVKLADAMTQQNTQDELKESIGEDFYMGDVALAEQESFSKFESKPATDNFTEYKKYKEGQLIKVRQTLKTLNIDRRNPKKNVKSILTQIERLHNIEAKIKNDIEDLNKNEVSLMFHALNSDIIDLNKVLDNLNYKDNKYDVEDIKDRLNFLFKLVKGRDLSNNSTNNPSLKEYKHVEFDKINREVDDLNDKYKDKLSELKDTLINSDISYVNNVLNNTNITPEELANMFNSKEDINWMEKTFLGITSSSSDDSVLPQILKSFLETKVALREAEVKTYQDRLSSLLHKLGTTNFDFIFEKSSKGNNTGNIINVISPSFNKALYEYSQIGKEEGITEESRYKSKVTWLKQHTNVIDFRKLSAVRDIYGNVYNEEFKFSEAEIERYEKQLQDTLGPLYEEEVNKVLNNLENFQLQKNALLEQTDNRFRHRDIAKIDPWAFVNNYYTPQFNEQINYTSGGTNTDFVYSDIQNIRFIPIKEVYVAFDSSTGDEIYKDSGYYNPAFNEIAQDPDKLAYWKLLKEIYSDYVNPLYNESGISDMSYAKFENEFLETILQAKGFQKGSKLFTGALHGFKAMFYERGRDFNQEGISKNYSDKTRSEINELTKALIQKGTNKEEAREEATKNVLGSYSTDINKVTSALLEMAALQKAKQDTLPIANLILDSHKLLKNDKGEDRKRSVEKMENWIDRVIKGENEKYRGSANFLGNTLNKNTWFSSILDKLGTIPFIKNYLNNKKAYLLSDNEKELLKHLEDLQKTGHNNTIENAIKVDGIRYITKQTDNGPSYFEVLDDKTVREISQESFEKMFQQNISNKIQELGLDLNAAGLIQGMLKTIIIKALGLNPISGIFNRIEGKNSGLVMDTTGKYWTKGNIHSANNFMAFANFIKFLPERFTPDQFKKVQELNKLQILIHNLNLIQDRKNELERHSDKSKFDYEKITNIYQFAVENPEFKNQGAILLSILMDTKIKDIDGIEVPVFNGKEFEIYNNVEGTLILKDKYKTPENISNWENFDIDETNLENNQYLLTKNKIKHAISRSQGNYDNLDVIDATKNIWGRSLTLFMKWMPEHVMQRFSSGKGIDVITGDTKQIGRYRTLLRNHPALLTTGVLGLFTGFGLTPVSALVGLGFTGFVVAKYFYDVYGSKSLQRETNNTLEFIDFAKSIVTSTLNYPLESFNSKVLITNSSYKQSNLTQEEIGNLQAVAKELGIKLTFIVMLLLAKKLTWDDDDDKKSKERQFHNFLDNQLTRMINSLSNWTNPEALASDVQRLAFLKYLWDLGKLLNTVATVNSKKDFKENLFKASPLPRVLNKGSMPWYDEKEFDTKSWMDKLIKSQGPKAALKEYTANLKEEIAKELEPLELSPSEYQKEFKKRLNKEKIVKSKDMTYKEAMEAVNSGETGQSFKIKRKAGKAERDAKVTELKDQGYEDSEIYEIMREEYSSQE